MFAKQALSVANLPPTLIYGLGRDKNIAEMARFIRRFGFFPVLGKATGLRQPIHTADVAGACLGALRAPDAANRDYNISGGETFAYRDMVARVFVAVGHAPDCRRLRLRVGKEPRQAKAQRSRPVSRPAGRNLVRARPRAQVAVDPRYFRPQKL
ncbi:MAG: hypothetical protein QMD17_03475 [Rhodocyclaceae bacterium]|nr:hypothetical protein [Rhodocyclaceae bacterium]